MIVEKGKYCNGCRERVAVKPCILWNTVKPFVTLRADDVPTYVNYEDATTPMKLHYCCDCWKAITKELPFKSEVQPF